MKKKVIAVLLSLSLAAGSVPGYAMAEEPGGPEGEIVVVEEEGPQEAAAPEEPEMEEAAELPEEAPAEDALIVEDGVEIAGIEELEIPEAEEPEVTDGAAVDAVEVSEDPEIELVEDGEAEDIANPDSHLPEADKTTERAYGLTVKDENNKDFQYAPQLSIRYKDREIKNATFTDVIAGVENDDDLARQEDNEGNNYLASSSFAIPTAKEKTGAGWKYYWIDENKDKKTFSFIYDPNYKKEYPAEPHQDLTKAMEILPELEIKWAELNEAGTSFLKDNSGNVRITTLQAGRDYTYDLVKEEIVGTINNTNGHATTAVIEITFCGNYGNISPLRIKYTIIPKSLDQEVGDERDKVKVTIDPSIPYDSTDKVYHLEYTGQPQMPTIVEPNGVTYKEVPLKKWDLEAHASRSNPYPNFADDKEEGYYDDWYTVTSPKINASENIKEEVDLTPGKNNNTPNPVLDGSETGKEVYGADGEKYYIMTVHGWGNYTDTVTYKYVIDQKKVEEGDVTGLNNETFYIELDEDKVDERIREKLQNELAKDKLNYTETREGYEIYYYKIVNGEEVLFDSEHFKNAPEADQYGKTAPGEASVVGRVNPTDRKRVEEIKGEYRYYIRFTGKGNFLETTVKDSPIKGTFFITDKEPHLTDVYNSVKKDLVDALRNDLHPTYDATDWFKREGGSVTNPNDVEETVKSVFNDYTYYKRGANGDMVECRAGDNIKVSLHPKHNGKMVNADRNGDGVFKTSDGSDGYVIRIEGINDWKDDLGSDGCIDMDEPDELIYVNPRNLDISRVNDSKKVAPCDYIDYTGARVNEDGGYIDGGYRDRFYVKDGEDTASTGTDYNKEAEAYEVYKADTDPYKEDDIYKYGAVQYLTEYKGSTYDEPEVTITHLVRDTNDAVEDDYKNYPLSVNQLKTNGGYSPLYVEVTNGPSTRVRAREKKLEVKKDFTIAQDSNFGKGVSWTTITGVGNYTGTVRIPTIQRRMINLANANVTVKVKSKEEPDGKYNTSENVIRDEKDGLNLNYDKGAGVDVWPNNVQVIFRTKSGKDQVIAPADYNVVIDTRNGDSMICQNCQMLENVGIGRHVHVGLHKILVTRTGKSGGDVTGFNEGEFYIRSSLEFSDDYMAVLNAPEGYTVPVGVKLKTGQAPHNYVEVVKTNSKGEAVRDKLNYQQEYEYVCYIPKAPWDAYQEGKAEEPDIAKYRMNVRENVEFEQEGQWYLVLKPANLAGSRVEDYEGYVTCEFTVSKKSFQTPDKNGTISAVVKDEYKDGITWPGHDITGPEIAKMLRVDDTEKLVDTELKYGVDYTIDGTVDKVGDSVPVTLKGMGSYNSEDAITVNIKVNPGSLKNAKIELTGNLYYKGEAFNGELGAIDRAGLDEKVTVATDDMNNVLPESDYTVVVEGEDETGKAGTNVTVKVKAVSVANGGHYADETADASATTVIQKADIANKDLFKLDGMPTEPKVHTTEPVTLTLTLTDNRNGKTVELKTEYVGNDKAGTATVTITPADADNYTGSIPESFTIVEEELSGRIELKAESFPFKEDNYAPADVIKAVYDKNGTEITSDKYTAVIKGDAKNAGKAAVVVTTTIDGKSVSLEKTFTIEPRKITDVTNLEATYVYNRNVIRPDVKVEADGIILQNKDYVIYNTEDPNVGAKEIVVQAIGNYTGNIAKQFTVVPASVEGASITGVKASYKYNGTARQPKVKVTVNGKVLKRDVDYKVTYSADSTAVGGKTATIEGTGNYTGSQVKAYSVIPAKAVVKSVKAGKKKLTVKVNAQAGVTYQIQYKVSGDDTWSSAKATGTKKVLKNLTSGKKYDIRVRAYATIDGARVNGAWSKITVKKVK